MGLVPFKEKMHTNFFFLSKKKDMQKLKWISLLEMVEIWICITVIAKLVILLVL